MNKKVQRRKRRATKTRMHIRELHALRLCVHRTPNHIYAQIIQYKDHNSKTLTQASTLDKDVIALLKVAVGDKKSKARTVGKVIAEKATALGIKKVAFDRSGFMYHGRVKALADGAREGGLEF